MPFISVPETLASCQRRVANSMRRFTKEVDMSKRVNTSLLRSWALAIAAPIVVAMVARAEEPKDIVFHDSYKQALHEARLTQKPIFLEFRCAP